MCISSFVIGAEHILPASHPLSPSMCVQSPQSERPANLTVNSTLPKIRNAQAFKLESDEMNLDLSLHIGLGFLLFAIILVVGFLYWKRMLCFRRCG